MREKQKSFRSSLFICNRERHVPEERYTSRSINESQAQRFQEQSGTFSPMSQMGQSGQMFWRWCLSVDR